MNISSYVCCNINQEQHHYASEISIPVSGGDPIASSPHTDPFATVSQFLPICLLSYRNYFKFKVRNMP